MFENNEQQFLADKIENTHRLTRIETILEHQNQVLRQILEQATKTNGRITVLELWKASFIGKITVMAAVMSAVVSLIGSAVIIALQHLLK